MRRAVLWAAVAAGCSGAASERPSPRAPTSASPRSLLVLYAGGAEVRVRAEVTGGALALASLPPGVRYTLRSVSGKAAAGARISGPAPRESWTSLRGAEVVARSEGKEVSGVITAIDGAAVLVQTDSGVEALTAPVEIERVGARPRSGPIRLEPRPGARGVLEVSSWLDQIRWSVGYTAVVDRGRARLQGWVSITNDGDRAIEVDDVAVSLAPGSPDRPSAARLLGRALALPAGAAVELPLAAPFDLAAAVVEVHDPIGDRLDHEGRRPLARASYGVSTITRATPLAVALSLDARHLEALPAGSVAVFTRGRDGRGGLEAVGVGRGFTPAARTGQPVDLSAAPPEPPSEKIVIGRSRSITGRRWQEELASDPDRRRLVEEIRVELHNRGQRPVVVDVREHLYRGLNWAIVYHNEPGPLVKTGTQEIRFAVAVPAGETRLVAYRVAYTW